MADLSLQYIAPNLAQPAEMPTTMSSELMSPTVPVDNQLTTNLNQFTQNVGVTQPTEGQLAKQMAALSLTSSLPDLFVGMHTGLANKVNQRIEQDIITNSALNGVTPFKTIETALDNFESNQSVFVGRNRSMSVCNTRMEPIFGGNVKTHTKKILQKVLVATSKIR